MKSKLFFEKGTIWENVSGEGQQVIVVAKGSRQVTSMTLDGSSKEQMKHWKFVLFYRLIGSII